MTVKIYKDMPRHIYDELEGINGSRLAKMADSPRHFQMNENKQTEAMALGTAIHMAHLEPGKFKEMYVVEPGQVECQERDANNKIVPPAKGGGMIWQPANKKFKDHREWLERWGAAQLLANKVILTVDEMEAITGMLNRITEEMKFPPKDPNVITLQEILSSKDCELVGTSEYRGHKLKGRIDLIANTRLGRTIVDLKKAASARWDLFGSKVYNLHYDMKAALYMEIFKADAFVWFAIEDKPPYAYGLYSAENFMGIGRKKMDKWLDRVAACEKENYWPWYSNGVEAPVPSDWQLRAYEEM